MDRNPAFFSLNPRVIAAPQKHRQLRTHMRLGVEGYRAVFYIVTGEPFNQSQN